MVRLPVVVATLLALGACSRPFDNVPTGFAEACYGGEENARRNSVCSQQRLMITTAAPESEWPLLGQIVSTTGRNKGLSVFDTSSATSGYIRTLEIYACSAEGVRMSLDKRVYVNAEQNRDGNELSVVLSTYHDSYAWRSLADDLIAEVSRKWPHHIETTFPPYNEHGAYPQDSVPTCDE